MTINDEVLLAIFKRLLRSAPTASWVKEGEFTTLTLHDPQVKLNNNEFSCLRMVLDNAGFGNRVV